MKHILLFSLLCFIISCDNVNHKNKKPSFLIGDWVRINNKKGTKTFESWSSNFKGLGYTLKQNDTIFKEKLSIITFNDSLFLKVEGVNENPTLFKFTSQTDTSFVCENSKNEFPKKIIYFKDKQQLKAIVSNGNYKIDFTFDQIKQ